MPSRSLQKYKDMQVSDARADVACDVVNINALVKCSEYKVLTSNAPLS